MLLEDAGLACAAGLSINIGQIRELTGYALEEDAQPQAGGFGGLANSATPLQTLAKPLQNAQTPSGATGVPQKGAEASAAILRGFADDTGPAAERIKSLLDRLDAGGDVREEAAKLAEELPSLMPGDPAMAAVLEEAMAEGFAQAAGGAAVSNSTDANGAEHAEAGSGNGGQFVGKGGGAADGAEQDGKFAIKGTGNKTGGKIENSIDKRQRECREALATYNASTDHPSADDVVSGKISIEEALKKGFEAKFGGQRVIFFTQQKIGDKYQGREENNRLLLIKHALKVRGNMFPVNHEGEQIGVVEKWTKANSNHRFVITADKETGVAVNIMRCSDAYIKRNYRR